MSPDPTSALKDSPTVVVRGTGSIGRRHLQVLTELGVKPFAFPFRSSQLRSDLSEFLILDSFESIKERRIAGAIVASNTGQHIADALKLLEAGCHVLVEKPLAVSHVGLAQLEAAAQKAGRKVFTGCCLRFNAALQAFRELLPKVGALHHVRIECQSYLPDWRPGQDYRLNYAARAEEGGVLRDLIHEIDYAVWLYGRPDEVFGRLHRSNRLELESEDSADLLWNIGTTSVSIHLDYLSRPARRVMRASGANGLLEWDALKGDVILQMNGGDEERRSFSTERNGIYREQAQAFLDSIQDHWSSDCLATIEDGAFAVALCDAARRSAASGRVEQIEDWRKR
jgi:predicted dehydrogenase